MPVSSLNQRNSVFPAVQAKFLKIRMLTPQNPAHPWASFAEIDLTTQP